MDGVLVVIPRLGGWGFLLNVYSGLCIVPDVW